MSFWRPRNVIPRRSAVLWSAAQLHAYVGPLYPTSQSDWHILDGVHQDLHGFLLSWSFSATIRRTAGISRHGAGTAWMLSDGGIYRSEDSGNNFDAAHNARTLSCVNVAGAFALGQKPALSLNTGDNDGFYSVDGGEHWSYQQYGGGDNDCSFADPLRPHEMMVFTPRWDTTANSVKFSHLGNTVSVYETGPGRLPNAALGTEDRVAVVGPPVNPDVTKSSVPDVWNANSSYVALGFRPIVLGLPGEIPPPPGRLHIHPLQRRGAAGSGTYAEYQGHQAPRRMGDDRHGPQPKCLSNPHAGAGLCLIRACAPVRLPAGLATRRSSMWAATRNR